MRDGQPLDDPRDGRPQGAVVRARGKVEERRDRADLEVPEEIDEIILRGEHLGVLQHGEHPRERLLAAHLLRQLAQCATIPLGEVWGAVEDQEDLSHRVGNRAEVAAIDEMHAEGLDRLHRLGAHRGVGLLFEDVEERAEDRTPEVEGLFTHRLGAKVLHFRGEQRVRSALRFGHPNHGRRATGVVCGCAPLLHDAQGIRHRRRAVRPDAPNAGFLTGNERGRLVESLDVLVADEFEILLPHEGEEVILLRRGPPGGREATKEPNELRSLEPAVERKLTDALLVQQPGERVAGDLGHLVHHDPVPEQRRLRDRQLHRIDLPEEGAEPRTRRIQRPHVGRIVRQVELVRPHHLVEVAERVDDELRVGRQRSRRPHPPACSRLALCFGHCSDRVTSVTVRASVG